MRLIIHLTKHGYQLRAHGVHCGYKLTFGVLNILQGCHIGRFLLKDRVRNPALGEWDAFYTDKDLYVGAVLEINSHTFLLTDADDYTFSYMERSGEAEKVAFSLQFTFFRFASLRYEYCL